MDIEAFARAVFDYCAATGGSVTSWGRTVSHNAAVGGVPTSLHLRWRAVDVVYDRTVELKLAVAVAAAFDLQVLREADHDHISPVGSEH
jgi:hypothetical protein